MSRPPRTPPKLMKRRPTDATAWFWGLVCLLAGSFYTAMFPLAALLFLGVPFFFLWQFKIWRDDRRELLAATSWCREHYPHAGGTPVVDFILAIVQNNDIDPVDPRPSTPIAQINGMTDDDQATIWFPTTAHQSQAFLINILEDAKIQCVDFSTFQGETLDDAIRQIVSSHTRDHRAHGTV